MKIFCLPSNGFACNDGYLDGLGVVLDLPFLPWLGMEIELTAPKDWGCDDFTFHVRDVLVQQKTPIVTIYGTPSRETRNDAYAVDGLRTDAERDLRALGWVTEEEAFGEAL